MAKLLSLQSIIEMRDSLQIQVDKYSKYDRSYDLLQYISDRKTLKFLNQRINSMSSSRTVNADDSAAK